MIEATTSRTGLGPLSSQAWCICSDPGALAGSSGLASLSISTSARARSGAGSPARGTPKHRLTRLPGMDELIEPVVGEVMLGPLGPT
jgi:hypothetical protein